MSLLSEAVAGLVEIRPVITRQEPGEAHGGGVHVETLPSLLDLLVEGTGSAMSGAGGSGSNIPIDADALEIHAQISERVAEWCRDARSPFERSNVAASMITWADRFDALYSARNVDDEAYSDCVRTVDGWCRWIEGKFNPDETREGRTPCPKCGLLKVKPDNQDEPERFAIELNVTKNLASCRNCDYQQRIPEWRFESNVAGRTDLEPEALKLLVDRSATTGVEGLQSPGYPDM